MESSETTAGVDLAFRALLRLAPRPILQFMHGANISGLLRWQFSRASSDHSRFQKSIEPFMRMVTDSIILEALNNLQMLLDMSTT